MGNEKQVLEIPYGTRDYLPGEATGKRAIETQLARLFALWGYDEVVTPTIEYLDTLTMDSGRSLSPQLFKLFDKGGRTLALRHEMTTPIARVVGSRLKDAPLPLKLSYISSVFRSEQSQMGRQCEFYQAGVELIGSASAAADAEVLALSIQSLLRSGLKKFQVCLGQVEFAAGIMEQYRISEDDQQTLKDALEQHDLVAYDAAIDELPLAAAAKKNLRQLPVLSGGEEVLTKAYSLALGEKSRRALDNL
ncbi:MAG: ATP phosphoribosyltransferase regulatory subunit, partial [Veillonellaceae bacterium]|nr:ATP phosphoribosyltransferase regulatory subunit [Veillonellaceae bacterium]